MRYVNAFGLLLICAQSGCMLPGSNSSSEALTDGGGNPLNAAFTLASPVAKTTMNLGETQVVNMTLSPKNSFRGTATLSLDRAAFVAADPGATISVKFSPATVDFSSGINQMVVVALTTAPNAPDLVGAKVPILVTEAGHNLPYTLTVPVPIDIVPVLNIEFHGGAVPETMVQGPGVFAQKTNINLAKHTAGVTLNFTDYDTTATAALGGAKNHLVHGQGQITHENTAGTGLAPANPATGPVAASTYSLKITTQTASTTGQFYCHQHESGNNARTITFNVPVKVVPPVIVPSGNPNATYSYVVNTIFKNYQCATCHGSPSAASTAGGNNDLSTFAAVQGFVVAGSPNASALYLAVAPPNASMPKMTPGSMSTTDLQALHDWINDGAKNN